jgi:hypothetical protein
MEAEMTIRKWMLAAAVLAMAAAGPGGAAGTGAQGPKPALSLRQDLSIGGLNDDALFQWVGLAVDRTGTIFVLDMMDYAVKKFGPDGKLLGRAGRKGQGPGEFLGPRLLDCSDRYVYAVDQYVMGVMVFDRDLKYLRTIRTPSLVSAMRALSGDRIAVHCLSVGEGGAILVLDGAGRILDRLDYMPRPEGFLQDSVSFLADGRSGFVIAYLFLDRVERWTAPTTLAWARSYFGGKPVVTEKAGEYDVPKETCFKDVARDSRGFLYVLAGNRAKHSGRDILVLDAGGALLQTLTLPEPSHCLYIDGKDRLYVRADDGIAVRRYEIRYE